MLPAWPPADAMPAARRAAQTACPAARSGGKGCPRATGHAPADAGRGHARGRSGGALGPRAERGRSREAGAVRADAGDAAELISQLRNSDINPSTPCGQRPASLTDCTTERAQGPGRRVPAAAAARSGGKGYFRPSGHAPVDAGWGHAWGTGAVRSRMGGAEAHSRFRAKARMTAAPRAERGRNKGLRRCEQMLGMWPSQHPLPTHTPALLQNTPSRRMRGATADAQGIPSADLPLSVWMGYRP